MDTKVYLDSDLIFRHPDKADTEFNQLDLDWSQLKDVYLFSNDISAIEAGFVYRETDGHFNLPLEVCGPHVVFIFQDGTVKMSDGLNCRNGVVGVHASEHVLTLAGVFNENSNINDAIYSFDSIHYYINSDGRWDYEVIERDNRWEYRDLAIFCRPLLYKGHIVFPFGLALDKAGMIGKTWMLETNDEIFNILKDFLRLVPNPVSVDLLSKEQAMYSNHTFSKAGFDYIFQIIITDKSGKEVWISYPFEEIPVSDRDNIYGFLKRFGLNFETEESLMDRTKKALGIPRKDVFGHYNYR